MSFIKGTSQGQKVYGNQGTILSPYDKRGYKFRSSVIHGISPFRV